MKRSFGLFERFGVELEYMLVDAETLDIRPAADRLIEEISGTLEGDVPRGGLEWSNELSLHLIELKTGKPVIRLNGLADAFQNEIRFINRSIGRAGMVLLPTAMHPWMNPARESRLWPHGNRDIYATFDRLFNCSGHGWTNLQSTHLNLSFRTAAEFRRLHTAIRLLLPLLPALAASSPFMEGRRAPVLDMRLQTYRSNCSRIPSLTGRVIPELIESPAEYRRRILRRIYRDLAPHDPGGVLQEEWANARGAIARFERNTIEIRVLDIQECPAADLAILQFVTAALRALTEESLAPESAQAKPTTPALERIMHTTIARAGQAQVIDRHYLRALGITSIKQATARELLGELLEAVAPRRAGWRPVIETILEEGTLAERIVRATGARPTRRTLGATYRRLADCLAAGQLFHA
jgi:gamma-glutamyl:cysteine ligase YbdK (ATP-grasp superfamily)